jgi:hypothetical protein
MTIIDDAPTRTAGREQHRPPRHQYAVGEAVTIICPEHRNRGAIGVVAAAESAALPDTQRYEVALPNDTLAWFGPAQLAPTKP